MDLQLRTNMGTASCCLVLQTNSEAVIKGVMLFAEQVSRHALCGLKCFPCRRCRLSRCSIFATRLLLFPCQHRRLLLQSTTPAEDDKLVPVQVFDGESFFYCPRPPASQVEVPLSLKKDAAVSMLIKVSINPTETCQSCATGKGCSCPIAPQGGNYAWLSANCVRAEVMCSSRCATA